MMIPDIWNKSILFSDIDGTLLDRQQHIGPRTLDTLNRWIDSGRRLVLCSSRSLSGIVPLITRYDLSAGVIALGGAHVIDEQGNTLFYTGMPRDTVCSLISLLQKEKLSAAWNVYTSSHWIVHDRADERVRQEEKIVQAQAEEGDPFLLPAGEKIGKVLLICRPDTLQDTRECVMRAFPQLTVTRSSAFLLQIGPSGVDKGSGVRLYLDHFGLTPADAAAFGDNDNDVPMLNAVSLPVLMGNAPDRLKACFVHHTLDHDHDGIGEALKQSENKH